MQKISLEQIKIICKTLKEKFPGKDRDFYKMGLSTELLRIMVDNEWVNQAIFQEHKIKPQNTEEDRSFFKTSSGGYQWQERVRRLAERIFNLQNINNIDDIIEKIKEGNLTSRFAELEIGTTFYRRNIPFGFVKPQGKKGFDFDIIINLNPPINCEVKHKIESTEISKKIISKSLNKARLQIPKEEPAIIGLKIPEEWTRHEEMVNILTETFDNFFKNNKNIIAILIRWEERDSNHKGVFFWKYKVECNKHSNKITKDVSKLIDKINSKPSKWIDFESVLNDCL
jgi:hypothetical protein